MHQSLVPPPALTHTADIPVDRALESPAPAPPERAPWTRSWFYLARGESKTFLWIIVIHLGALSAFLLPLPPLSAVLASAGAIFLGGLGTTVCYHRALAHRSVRLHPIVEQILIFAAMFNGSGSPRTWVAMHRLHHAVSDRDTDISSPRNGFWWAHLRWLWQADQRQSSTYAPDLDRPRYQMWQRLQLVIVLASLLGGLLWGWHHDWKTACAAAVWFGPIRLVWALHAQCTVNSICHLGERTDEHGSARNVAWLSLVHMGQGENWHANHHRGAGDARLGRGWQIDIGWWVIRSLGAVRLATHIKRRRSS